MEYIVKDLKEQERLLRQDFVDRVYIALIPWVLTEYSRRGDIPSVRYAVTEAAGIAMAAAEMRPTVGGN